MELQVKNSQAAMSVNDTVFAADFKEGLVHQVVTAYLAGARAGTKAQKSRSDVRGGGAKPWRQKGTGRARAGTIRSPLWRGGGRTFAAAPRDHAQKVNKKQYRAAMRSIFSELTRRERLIVIDVFSIARPKTKEAVSLLNDLGVEKALLVSAEVSENVYLATRNLPGVFVSDVAALDPVSLVGSENVVMTVAAVKAVEEWLA